MDSKTKGKAVPVLKEFTSYQENKIFKNKYLLWEERVYQQHWAVGNSFHRLKEDKQDKNSNRRERIKNWSQA